MEALEFLYHTVPGRVILKALIQPKVSRACGRFLDSPNSKCLIRPFVKKNNIDLSDYELQDIHSFNDFFSRKIKPDRRMIDEIPSHMIAPCDGLLSVWKINNKTILPVKQSHYTLESLLRNKKLAEQYKDGYCFVFRLCVNHYHRYCYADSGKKSQNVFLPGVLHTVRPIALAQEKVFCENSREYTLIRTQKFKTILQMEVGAMLVGRIVNYEDRGVAVRGKEKGMFQYGGSTIIVLTQKDAVNVREDLLIQAELGQETAVKMGEMIGYVKEN